MLTQGCGPRCLILALGANIRGTWGTPASTLERAFCELSRSGLRLLCRSALYRTKPVGSGHQPDFLNAVMVARTDLSPVAVLRLAKQLEAKAGRRLIRRWGPRPLDIDIVDFGGRRLGWRRDRSRCGRLILPHPEAHRRAFVLVPMLDVAPRWRHPILGMTARELLRRLSGCARQNVSQTLDSAVSVCEKPR